MTALTTRLARLEGGERTLRALPASVQAKLRAGQTMAAMSDEELAAIIAARGMTAAEHEHLERWAQALSDQELDALVLGRGKQS